MMEATVLIRTGSGRFLLPPTPSEHHHHHHDGPVLSRTRSAGAFYARSSPTAVHLEMRDQNHRQDMRGVPLRRAVSCDSTAFLTNNSNSSAVLGHARSVRSPPSTTTATSKSAVLDEGLDLEFSGGGAGRGSRVGGGGRPGRESGDHRSGMEAYYKEMLQADPENPLLLMNYGKFLHEVQGDLQGAEDCFGRAVLASPADAEALSLYGNLMWEAHKDEQRADDYFQRAVQAAPDDCYVLGSYAHFLWDADDEEGGDPDADNKTATGSASSAPAGNAVMVKAY